MSDCRRLLMKGGGKDVKLEKHKEIGERCREFKEN